MKVSNEIKKHAGVLWDFHRMQFDLEAADLILGMGSHDERVAEHAAKLYLDDLAPLVVMSGGFGKVTRASWDVSEGERFMQIALQLGVPRSAILVESEATNTGDNIVKTRELLSTHGIHVDRGILVTKPYMCRRAYAAAAQQWPDVEWAVSAPNLTFEEYPNDEVNETRMISLMVGDLQRLKVYAEMGFQIPQYIPDTVWASYEFLRDAGYDEFVLNEK